MKLNKMASKFSILKNFGINGIKFNTNKMNGKSAMKKLNEIEGVGSIENIAKKLYAVIDTL